MIDREAPLEPKRAVRVARQIAVALSEIHAKGVVHRDLKPRNIMLGEGDFVKVVDFGLAKIDGARVSTLPSDEAEEDARLTGRGAIFGTVEYLAPEAAFGMELVDARADLFALGVMLYEMLSGKHPFDAKSEVELFAKQRLADPPRICERNPDVVVDAALEAVALRLMSKDFDLRHQTGAEVVAALDAAEPEGSLAPPEPEEPPLSESAESAKERLAAATPSTPKPIAPSAARVASRLGGLPSQSANNAVPALRGRTSAQATARANPPRGPRRNAQTKRATKPTAKHAYPEPRPPRAALAWVSIGGGDRRAERDLFRRSIGRQRARPTNRRGNALRAGGVAPNESAPPPPASVDSGVAVPSAASPIASASPVEPVPALRDQRRIAPKALGQRDVDAAMTEGLALVDDARGPLREPTGIAAFKTLLSLALEKHHADADSLWRAGSRCRRRA